MLRVLYITRVYPFPCRTGALQYTRILIEAFAQASDALDVVCALDSRFPASEPTQDFPENVGFIRFPMIRPKVWQRVITMKPHASLPMESSASFEALQRGLAKRPSLVVIDHIGATWALRFVPQGTPMIYCTHNDEFKARLSIARAHRNPITACVHFLDAIRILRRDRYASRRGAVFAAISKADLKSQTERYAPRGIEYWPPHMVEDTKCLPPITAQTPRRIVVLGSLLWSAKKSNLLTFLANNALPLFERRIELVIAGRAESAFMAMLRNKYPHVEIVGEVAETSEILQDVRLAVLHGEAGGGFRMTALTYIFSGRPIISTSALVEDLDLTPEDEFVRCDNETRLYKHAERVIDKIDYLNSVATKARIRASKFKDPQDLHRRVSACVKRVTRS